MGAAQLMPRENSTFDSKIHRRSLELRQELIQLDPEDPTLQHAVGESLHNVAILLGDAHQRAALELLQRTGRRQGLSRCGAA